MLPNHSPLTIAEQFGTLATLHPGRIDLGLGPGPGHRPDHRAGAAARTLMPPTTFPQDVLELQAYLRVTSCIPASMPSPGKGTDVPIYHPGLVALRRPLAAELGLPYGFASHFAPAALCGTPSPSTGAPTGPPNATPSPSSTPA